MRQRKQSFTRLWRVEWNDANEGYRVSWHPTQGDASLAVRALRNEADEDPDIDGDSIRSEPVDIPQDKHELAEWLTERLSTENG